MNGQPKKTDIVMNIPLFLRALEWAREEAMSDVQLHVFTEFANRLSQEKGRLTMSDYDRILNATMAYVQMNGE